MNTENSSTDKRKKDINQRNFSQLTTLLFLKAKQNENLTASGSCYYARCYWSRRWCHNEMKNDVFCPSRYVRPRWDAFEKPGLSSTSVFDSRWRPLWFWALGHGVNLWSSLVALTLLIACIGSFGSSGADAFHSALHFKKSVLPKPRAGQYGCLLINRSCVSHWDMNSTRAARETDIEVNPRSPLQAWY